MKTHAGVTLVLVSQANLLSDWSHDVRVVVTNIHLFVELSNLQATLAAT